MASPVRLVAPSHPAVADSRAVAELLDFVLGGENAVAGPLCSGRAANAAAAALAVDGIVARIIGCLAERGGRSSAVLRGREGSGRSRVLRRLAAAIERAAPALRVVVVDGGGDGDPAAAAACLWSALGGGRAPATARERAHGVPALLARAAEAAPGLVVLLDDADALEAGRTPRALFPWSPWRGEAGRLRGVRLVSVRTTPALAIPFDVEEPRARIF